MALFSSIIRRLLPRDVLRHSLSLEAAPLSPRRLECRRLLDASAAGLLFAPLGDSGEFVQVGENIESSFCVPEVTSADGEFETDPPPSNIQFAPVAAIDENNFAQLRFTFENQCTLDTPTEPRLIQFGEQGTFDTHQVEIDWGDGAATKIELMDGERFVGTSHQYLDDTPTGPEEVPYTIKVKITDDDGGVMTGQTGVLVKNVAPSNIQFASVATIDENNFTQLRLTFEDPGTIDTHTVEVDWGDGATTKIELLSGERFVGTSHQYLDDTPTGPAEVPYKIKVKITDDDGGVITGETGVLVKNVAPSNIQFASVATIDESNFAQLRLTFEDPGTIDTHTVEIDWGDGGTTKTELLSGERFVGTSHQYLDDTPTGPAEVPYKIKVKITDDDGGVATGETSVLVKNVAPVIEKLTVTPLIVSEGNYVTLRGSFSDVGTLDTHGATIRWGDGTIQLVSLQSSGGSGSFEISHLYADNDTVNPNDGLPADNIYTITATVGDDDGGQTTHAINAKVLNVSPNLEPIISATNVNARGETYLTIRFRDPGADKLTIFVDWGDVRDPSNSSIPALNPFVITLTDIDAPGIFTVTLKHTYRGPQNGMGPGQGHPIRMSPASDIDIAVFVTDDDFGEPMVSEDGMSRIRRVSITNPGTGPRFPGIVRTPRASRLLFSRQEANTFFREDPFFKVEEAFRGAGIRVASGDFGVRTDQFLELRVIDSSGELSEGYRLKTEVLDDLPGLFRKLPDNHYAIYLVRIETNTSRLVREVYVRNGKVIDPGDDTEGTRDRPPTDETTHQPGEVQKPEIKQPDAGENAAPVEPVLTPPDDTSTSLDLPAVDTPTLSRPTLSEPMLSKSGQSHLNWGSAAVGLVATTSFGSWAKRVDRTLARAKPRQWKKLRTQYPHKRKNR